VKHFFKIFFALLVAFTSVSAKVHVPEKPQPERLVNDLAKLLTEEQKQILEQKLVAFADSTSNQIEIVIVSSLNDDEPSDVALGILREWGVGQKQKNNGIVLLIAPNERKVFITTGDGLEGVLPDGVCKLIIEKEIKPLFKQNDYFNGINNGIDAICKATRGEYHADENDYRKPNNKKGSPIAGLIIIIIIVIIIIGRFNNRGGGTMIGGGGYGGMFLAPLIFGGGSSGGGGNWGDSGGGGFGGFGGGSGSGGGAGGSW
jgi:uncharacterized protein